MDTSFGSTWNVWSLYRTGSITAAEKELAKYKSDLMGVQEVRWDRGGTKPATDFTFFCRNRNKNHEFGVGFFTHKRII
jgi:hypothetical protein